jgi:hypothetical protein
MWLNGELDRFTAAPTSRNFSGSLIYRYSRNGRVKLFAMHADDNQGVSVDQAEFSGQFQGSSVNKFYNLQQSDILFSNIFMKNSVSINTFNNSWKLGILDLEIEDKVMKFRSDIEAAPNKRTGLNLGIEIERRENRYLGKIPALDYDIRLESNGTYIDEMLQENRIGCYFELVASGINELDDLFIIGGLRFDYLTDYSLQWLNPRLGIGYRINSNSRVTAGAGIFSQMPDLRLMTQIDGNPSLKELSAVHYTLSYELNFVNNKSLRTELYYKDYSNLPLEHDSVNYTNDGYGYAYGIDFILKGKLPIGLEGWISYGFINTKRKWMDFTELTSSSYDITHNLSVVLKYYITAMLQLGINYKCATGRPFTPVTGAVYRPEMGIYQPVYGSKNSERFGNYQRLDLRITYLNQLFRKYFTVIYLEALNILDLRNIFGYTYNFDYSQIKEVQSYFGRRTIVVGVQVTF